MNCPLCASPTTKEQTKKTSLGYRTFRCSDCRRIFNERTGTPFTFLEYPTDIVLLVVFWRFRYTLSLRDLAEMFLERGFEFTHEAVREWEARFAPLIADQLRAKRRGQAGRSWYVDETYVNVKGKWCSLYLAIDRDGNLVDSMLSEKRDREAAKRKRMLKAHWPRPAGYAQGNLECMNKNLVLRKETMQTFFAIAARKRHQAKERRSVRRILLRFGLQVEPKQEVRPSKGSQYRGYHTGLSLASQKS